MKKDLTNIKGYIYKITAPNGAVYVGQTLCVKKRKYQYKKLAFTKQTQLWNNCQKYNWNPSETFEVIDDCLCGEDKVFLNEKEIYWISFYDSYRNGLNCTEGGKGQVGRIWTQEERDRQREITKSNGSGFTKGNKITLGRKLSDEHRAKISESNKGHKAWNKGKETPQEVKEKIIISTSGEKNHFYGKTHSDETKEKIKESKLGFKHTDETKLRMSNSSKRMYHPHFYGKAVLQYDMENNFIKKYDSIKSASLETGCSKARIVDVCKGRRKHTKNFIFIYEKTQSI
jgi:group I intron endonuclease